MPITVTHFVDTDGIIPSSFSTLTSWEAANQRDLVLLDEEEEVLCSGSAIDTTECTIFGWKTNPTHRILLKGDPGNNGEWKGIPNQGYIHATSTGNDILCGEKQVVFENLTAKELFFGDGGGGTYTYVIEMCRITLELAMRTQTSSGLNNIVMRNTQLEVSALDFENKFTDIYMYNCIDKGSTIDVRANDRFFVKNTWFKSLANFKAALTYGSVAEATTSFSEDVNPTTEWSTIVTFTDQVTPDFVDEVAGDHHLTADDTIMIGNGTDLSTDPLLPFTTDVDSQTRSAPWDAGLDQMLAINTSLTGDSSSSSIGSLIPAQSNTLIGEALVPSLGLLTNTLNTNISGLTLDTSLGIILYSAGGVVVELSGESFQSLIGSLEKESSSSLNGNLSSFSQGFIDKELERNIIGTSIQLLEGNVDKEIQNTLLGLNTSSSNGTLSYQSLLNLSGIASTTESGNLLFNIVRDLSGVSLDSLQGVLENEISNLLVGSTLTLSEGNLLVPFTKARRRVNIIILKEKDRVLILDNKDRINILNNKSKIIVTT